MADNGTPLFTQRDGKQVPIPPFQIPPAEMTTILRLKEDFEQRGEYLSTLGVVLHVIDLGTRATRNYWKNAELNKNKREFATGIVQFLNSDGTVRDAEGIANLAMAKGLVKGSPRQV